MKRFLAFIFAPWRKPKPLTVTFTGFDPAALYSHDHIRRLFDELEPRK